MRRLSAIAAAGLTSACLVGATPWVAQAHTLDTGVRVAAVVPAADDPTTPTDTPTDTTPPTTPSDTSTDTPTETTSSSSTTTEPPTDGGGIGVTVTATLPSLPGLPGDNGNGHGNGHGNDGGGSVPTGSLDGGNAGADGAVKGGACGGLLCAGSSYQNAVGAQDPARAQAPAQSGNPVLAYTGANIVPLLSLAAALLMLGIGTLVVRSRLQAAHQRRH